MWSCTESSENILGEVWDFSLEDGPLGFAMEFSLEFSGEFSSNFSTDFSCDFS